MPVISNSPLDVLRRRAWDLCVEACKLGEKLYPNNVWHDAVSGDFEAIQNGFPEPGEGRELAIKFVEAFEELQQAEKDLLKSPWE